MTSQARIQVIELFAFSQPEKKREMVARNRPANSAFISVNSQLELKQNKLHDLPEMPRENVRMERLNEWLEVILKALLFSPTAERN